MGLQKRHQGLDILRGIAVILVLFRHSYFTHTLVRFGWLGVDLFFALSGFLIAGLLFSEYKSQGSINIQRFLGRRAFKIFPPFYFFLLTTVLFDFVFLNKKHNIKELAAEIFYLQSYFPRVWLHTWSLAVEEHFYLIFSLLMLLVIKKRWLHHRPLIIGSLLFLLFGSLALRLQISYPHRNDVFFCFMQSHLRADGILLGILLAYLHHFTKLTKALLYYPWSLLLLGLCLLLPGALLDAGSFFMNTSGISLVNLGFALLVLLSLDIESFFKPKLFFKLQWLMKVMAFIGIHSYSIYLWHLNIKRIVDYYLDSTDIHVSSSYIILSILIGILFSYLIEKSALNMRDKLLPSTTAIQHSPTTQN